MERSYSHNDTENNETTTKQEGFQSHEGSTKWLGKHNIIFFIINRGLSPHV